MYELILSIANDDERIHAVYMNGSRVNKNIKNDIFQDYDIVYVVNETSSFIRDKKWIENFGEILYMQYPDESPYYPSNKEKSYGWLMQLADGNRIDLHVETIESAKENIFSDKLCKILLDKSGILPQIPEATDKDYWVKRPNKEEYIATCNEFWWCSNNIAKGLWREEIWESVMRMCDLFENTAIFVGKELGYEYNSLEERKAKEFLKHVRQLSKDASEIY